ncbi:MAG: peptidoglycan-binding protein [Cyanobacteria bacterium SBLK]|nr:peptidoglycan-binding protein [Cyanobacteria bacterium SBLK]
METLAFTYYSASYEDPSDREGKALSLPNSQPIGLLVGTFTLLSLLGTASSPSRAMSYRGGSRGETVAQIQQALGIAADGIYGPRTERAVRDYQKRRGLRWIDGIAGNETLSALGINTAENTGGQFLQAIVRTPDRQGVNVRSTPNGSKIGGLADGASVSLTGDEWQIGSYHWVKIARGGWVAKTFLQPATGRQQASLQSFSQARVTTPSKRGVNLRDTPNGERVGSLPEGTIVMLTGRERAQSRYTWVETHQGTWIAKNFLQGIETQSRSDSASALSTPPREPFLDRADRLALNSVALTQKFQGDRGQFPASQTAPKYDRPNGTAIGSLQAGEKLRVTRERALANGIAWAKLADGYWVDSRAIGF